MEVISSVNGANVRVSVTGKSLEAAIAEDYSKIEFIEGQLVHHGVSIYFSTGSWTWVSIYANGQIVASQ